MWRWEWALLAVVVVAAIAAGSYTWQKITALIAYASALLLSDPFLDRERCRLSQWLKTTGWRSSQPPAVRMGMFILREVEPPIHDHRKVNVSPHRADRPAA